MNFKNFSGFPQPIFSQPKDKLMFPKVRQTNNSPSALDGEYKKSPKGVGIFFDM